MRAGVMMASLFLLAASAAEGPVRRSVSVKGYEFSRGRLIELARQAIRGSRAHSCR